MAKKLIISDEHRLDDLTGVGKTIRPLAKQLLGKNGLMQIELATNWEEIIGPVLYQYVLPYKIYFSKDERTNGVLTLVAFGGAFALEAENKKNKILQKVNAFFGYEALNKIKIIQNNSPENFLVEKNVSDKLKKNLVSESEETYINEMLEGVENEKLRHRLKSLGKAVLGCNKK